MWSVKHVNIHVCIPPAGEEPNLLPLFSCSFGYHRQRGSYHQLPHARALKIVRAHRCHCPRTSPALCGGRCQLDGRFPMRVMIGFLAWVVGGAPWTELAGLPHGWPHGVRSCPRFYGGDPRTFGVGRIVLELVAKKENGITWHQRVQEVINRLMISWHKGEDKASRVRTAKRDAQKQRTRETTAE